MKQDPLGNDTIKNIWESANFIGNNKAHGIVTVEPGWHLRETNSVYAGYSRGPYRWWEFQGGESDPIDPEYYQYVVPNIKSIDINRSVDQPVASCSIVIYNQWHNLNTESPELLTQLGKPGYFWYERGKETDEQSIQVARWNQQEATGAYCFTTSEWDAEFSWRNVLVPNAMLRTYQGYGGFDVSPWDAVQETGNLTKTGCWIIDSVSAGTDGMLTISCRDVGKLLEVQRVYPDLVPPDFYPLEYVPAGSDVFDSPWQQAPQYINNVAVSQIGMAKVPLMMTYSSLGVRAGSTSNDLDVSVDGHTPRHARDRDSSTWSWSQATNNPNNETDWWQWHMPAGPHNVSRIVLKCYGGGYRVYVSLYGSGAWKTNGYGLTVPAGDDPVADTAIPYVDSFPIPRAQPGEERAVVFDLPYYNDITDIRLSFQGYQKYDAGGYRCGIRDFDAVADTQFVTNTNHGLPSNEYASDIASHPVSGYWMLTNKGRVFTAGSAQHYGDGTEIADDPCTAIAAMPNGDGYYILRSSGTIEAKGSATLDSWNGGMVIPAGWYGTSISDPFGFYALKATGICVASDGAGYAVVYSNGVVHLWGSLAVEMGTNQIDVWGSNPPDEDVFMEAISNAWPIRYRHKRGTGIAAHPTGLGIWVLNGSGRVAAYGDCVHYGEFVHRTYTGNADKFTLGTTYEHCDSIRATEDGKGYWVTCGSGRIAQFGNAVGLGPVDLYAGYRDTIPEDPYAAISPEAMKRLFRALIQGLARRPDNDGFYVVSGSGDVQSIRYNWWGNPAYWGHDAKFHDGIIEDYVDIVRELLMWSGFTVGGLEPDAVNPVLGALESTGINSSHKIPLDKFDKQTILDVINQIREIVGYLFFIDDDGGAHFESANIWKAGNFLTTSGLFPALNADPDSTVWTEEILELDERTCITSYSATVNSDAYISEIIVGSTLPNFADPSRTAFYRYVSPQVTAALSSGGSLGRGIQNIYTWTSEFFDDPEEMRIMAQLLALRVFFAQRLGSVSIHANPMIQINDQVKIIERNTSESFIHYIRSIDSSMDLDTGEYTMRLTTNWLGSSDGGWTITKDNITDPMTEWQISELVDAWQDSTGRGLVTSSLDSVTDTDVPTLSVNFQEVPAVDISASTGSEGAVVPQFRWVGTLVTSGGNGNVNVTCESLSSDILGEVNVFVLGDGGDFPTEQEYYEEENQGFTGVGQKTILGPFVDGEIYTILVTSIQASEVGSSPLHLRFHLDSGTSRYIIANVNVGNNQSQSNSLTLESWISGATPMYGSGTGVVGEALSFDCETNADTPSYYWDFGVEGATPETSVEKNPSYTYEEAGEYLVQVTVHDTITGLMVTDTITVLIEEA